MSILEYVGSRKLVAEIDRITAGNEFITVIMAAMRLAGSEEMAKLEAVFPRIAQELRARYNAPGGHLPGER